MFFWPKDYQIALFESNWASNETADEKYIRLKAFALKMHQKDSDQLTIIGVSAGGSLAVRYAYENPNFHQCRFLF